VVPPLSRSPLRTAQISTVVEFGATERRAAGQRPVLHLMQGPGLRNTASTFGDGLAISQRVVRRQQPSFLRDVVAKRGAKRKLARIRADLFALSSDSPKESLLRFLSVHQQQPTFAAAFGFLLRA